MYQITLQLTNDSDKCLYEQLYEHIRQEIIEGRLLAGERLPSTRSLAEYLQVSRSTVDTAYEQLLWEGYIEARPYKGFFVCSTEAMLNLYPSTKINNVETPIENEEPESVEIGTTNIIYDFSPHSIDMTGFPFSVWKKITKEILIDSNQELFSQGKGEGDFELRATISRYLHSQRGVNCRPEQIIVGAGNDYLLMLLEKILDKKLTIAMENPTYKRAYNIFQKFSYDIVTVGMDEFGICVDELQNTAADIAYVMPSHQFPTGVVMPVGRRLELLRWAYEKENRYVIEDDYDSEFRYHGKPIPALQASDEQEKVIYIGTFSKAIAPAIRVSYMVLPKELLKKYYEECYFFSCTVSRIDQRILNEFIKEGHFERHLNKMRRIYKAKHDLLLECLKPLEKNFTISGENAGLHLVLTPKKSVNIQRLVEQAKEAGVKIYHMADSLVKVSKDSGEFADGELFEKGEVLLLGFGGLTNEQIKAGMDRLLKAWS